MQHVEDGTSFNWMSNLLFLQVELSEDAYIKQPEGYVKKGKSLRYTNYIKFYTA